MSSSVIAALATALSRDAGRPLLTFYDGATGERIELSVKTFDNWVSKVANLFADELMLDEGDAIAIDLPTHWQSGVLVVGAWAAGLHVADLANPSALTVVGPAALDDASSLRTPVLATSLRPMGGPFAEPLPDGWLDFAREIPPQPDALLVGRAVRPNDLAVARRSARLTHAELFAAGTAAADSLGMMPGDRLITDANPADPDDLVTALVAPLVSGGSVVLVVNASHEARADITRQEGATSHYWLAPT